MGKSINAINKTYNIAIKKEPIIKIEEYNDFKKIMFEQMISDKAYITNLFYKTVSNPIFIENLHNDIESKYDYLKTKYKNIQTLFELTTNYKKLVNYINGENFDDNIYHDLISSNIFSFASYYPPSHISLKIYNKLHFIRKIDSMYYKNVKITSEEHKFMGIMRNINFRAI